jgi:ATP phosphoribosyltransferase
MSLNIVLPSGRLLNKSKEYFINSGIDVKEPEGRKLTNINDDYSFFIPGFLMFMCMLKME